MGAGRGQVTRQMGVQQSGRRSELPVGVEERVGGSLRFGDLLGGHPFRQRTDLVRKGNRAVGSLYRPPRGVGRPSRRDVQPLVGGDVVPGEGDAVLVHLAEHERVKPDRAARGDFPELTTFGDDRAEALMRAVGALEEAVAARIRARQDIPVPSQGETRVSLPTLTAVKVILYQGMRDQDVGKAELARRLGWHLPQVDRVLDVNHHSRLDQMDAALGAIGLRLEVTTSKEAA